MAFVHTHPALATTPTATPEIKTTARRRKGAAQSQDQLPDDPAPRQLQFQSEPVNQPSDNTEAKPVSIYM